MNGRSAVRAVALACATGGLVATSALASRAGVWQGLWGSMLLMVFVVALAFPIGIAAAIYLGFRLRAYTQPQATQ